MIEGSTVSALSRWENFYVIVGSSAGALTGLQFVVMALIAGSSNVIQPTLLNFCKNLCIDKSVSPNLTKASPRISAMAGRVTSQSGEGPLSEAEKVNRR